MPFVQMENISHFLRACQSPPLNLQSHDIFQTVDLYESKDPAQVLQCVSSFSRRAHSIQPSKFPSMIGEKNKGGLVSPQSTGGFASGSARYGRPRGASNTSETSSTPSYQSSRAIGGRDSPSRFSETSAPKATNGSASTAGGVSSWSKKTDESATTPAWNIHQYGYMGGASQGNQGITFGGRRQITTPAPKVPSLAEKERKRREQEAEAEQLRLQAEEVEHRRRVEREAEEERQRRLEEQRWEEETRRNREQERLRVEEEKRRWEEEERRWKQEEEARIQEEKEAEARLARQTNESIAVNESRPKLQGQYLSQYKAQQAQKPKAAGDEAPERLVERERVKDLERQLEEAKKRELRYEQERQERIEADQYRERETHGKAQPSGTPINIDREDSWRKDERDYLRNEWSAHNPKPQAPSQPPRPLPTPQKSTPASVPPIEPSPTPLPPPISSIPPRPLPNPAEYSNASPRQPSPQRKSPFARPSPPAISNSTPPPTQSKPLTTPTKKPPFAKPSSLLSREMELDRLRQQEWEEGQKATKVAAAAGVRDGGINPGDGSWDTSQYGYLGGDSQNRGGTGIGFGGRRQLVGPREPPGKS